MKQGVLKYDLGFLFISVCIPIYLHNVQIIVIQYFLTIRLLSIYYYSIRSFLTK